MVSWTAASLGTNQSVTYTITFTIIADYHRRHVSPFCHTIE